MKRLFAIVIMAVMTLTLAACGSNAGAGSSQTEASGTPTMQIIERGSSEAVRNSTAVTQAASAQETVEAGQASAAGQDEAAKTEAAKTEAAKTEAAKTEVTQAAKKSLVVYFSWSGNTEKVAKEIQQQTGADIFRIVPATPYTDNYNELLNVAQQEKKSNARPQIAQDISNFEQYDTIYFGFPNWWSDMPMIMYTFLDKYDMSGKTVAPFVTSGGSGFSGTINEIKKQEPAAKVTDGLSLGSSEAASCSGQVSAWLDRIR